MATLVQTFPPQTTAPTLTTRPSSSGGYNSASTSQFQGPRGNHMSRYNAQSGPGYRGIPSTGPVAPYAFTSTPQLASTRVSNSGHSARSASTSMLPQMQPLGVTQPKGPVNKQQPSSTSSVNTVSLDFSKVPALDLSFSSVLSPPAVSSPTAAKPSPDRYRRNVRRVDSSESGVMSARAPQGPVLSTGPNMATGGQIYSHPAQSSSSPSLTQYHSYRGSVYTTSGQTNKTSADDMIVGRSQNADLAARYRRRSLGSIETAGLIHAAEGGDNVSPHPNTFVPKQPVPVYSSQLPNYPPQHRPTSAHAHTPSAESVASSRSGRSGRPTSVGSSPPH